MAGSELTTKEQEKADILIAAIAGRMTNERAGKQLGLSTRQIQRAKAGIRQYGIKTVIHQLKGKLSNHAFTEDTKMKVVAIIKQKYGDFKPTFATEQLEQQHDIHISRETTRLWMIEQGLWKVRKQKRSIYRSWRERKPYYGELQQFDGSYHLWFENRYCDTNESPIEVCLLAVIDDATGQITQATFSANEGVIAVFTFWKQYIQKIGKPLAIYLDKFSTYKINHKAAVDNSELITQFERVMKHLGIELITAHSPQAKGRIERLFQTLQDRLIKEMRLAGISTPEQGNTFLEEIFIPKFNKRFSVIAQKEGDVHKPLTTDEREHSNHIFSIQFMRKVNNDFTIQFKNKWYQLQEIQPTTVRARMTVLIQEWLDGSIHIVLEKYDLTYKVLPQKPKKQKSTQPTILTTHRLNWKPPPNHPWKTFRG